MNDAFMYSTQLSHKYLQQLIIYNISFSILTY